MNDENNIYGFKETEVDTHAMKNLEWGSVAYLSQSKYGKYGNPNYECANKEIYQKLWEIMRVSPARNGFAQERPLQQRRIIID